MDEGNPFDGNPGAWEQYILGVWEPKPPVVPSPTYVCLKQAVRALFVAPWGSKLDCVGDSVDEWWYTRGKAYPSPAGRVERLVNVVRYWQWPDSENDDLPF